MSPRGSTAPRPAGPFAAGSLSGHEPVDCVTGYPSQPGIGQSSVGGPDLFRFPAWRQRKRRAAFGHRSGLVARSEALFRVVSVAVAARKHSRISAGETLPRSLEPGHAQIGNTEAPGLERRHGRRYSLELPHRRRTGVAASERCRRPSGQRDRPQLPAFSTGHPWNCAGEHRSPATRGQCGGRRGREAARRHSDRRSRIDWRERGGTGGRTGRCDERRHSGTRDSAAGSPQDCHGRLRLANRDRDRTRCGCIGSPVGDRLPERQVCASISRSVALEVVRL